MALVSRMTEIRKDRQTVHAETTCHWSVFTDDSGDLYLQLDTYGSPGTKLTFSIG